MDFIATYPKMVESSVLFSSFSGSFRSFVENVSIDMEDLGLGGWWLSVIMLAEMLQCF